MLAHKLCWEAGWQLSFPCSGESQEPAALPQILGTESLELLSEPSNGAQPCTMTPPHLQVTNVCDTNPRDQLGKMKPISQAVISSREPLPPSRLCWHSLAWVVQKELTALPHQGGCMPSGLCRSPWCYPGSCLAGDLPSMPSSQLALLGGLAVQVMSHFQPFPFLSATS